MTDARYAELVEIFSGASQHTDEARAARMALPADERQEYSARRAAEQRPLAYRPTRHSRKAVADRKAKRALLNELADLRADAVAPLSTDADLAR